MTPPHFGSTRPKFPTPLIRRYRRVPPPFLIPSVSPAFSPSSTTSSLFLPCGPESPVTMVTAERWLQPFESHTHMHTCTCYLYEVMATILHVAECSSLCPVTITWPPLPLTEMKNITGRKIHVHAQESLCYSHSQLVVKIWKDKVLCSYYPLMKTSTSALSHFGIPLSVQKCSGKDNKVSDSLLEHEQDWDWNICLLSLSLHGCPIHYPSAPHPILHCTALLLDKYVLKRVCKEGRPLTNSLLQGRTETDRGEIMHTNTHAHTQIRVMVMNRFGPTSSVLFLLLSLSW